MVSSLQRYSEMMESAFVLILVICRYESCAMSVLVESFVYFAGDDLIEFRGSPMSIGSTLY